jgi:hypothetical protein
VGRIRLTALPKTSFISMQSVRVFRNVSHSIFCKSFQGRPEGGGHLGQFAAGFLYAGVPERPHFYIKTYYNLAG